MQKPSDDCRLRRGTFVTGAVAVASHPSRKVEMNPLPSLAWNPFNFLVVPPSGSTKLEARGQQSQSGLSTETTPPTLRVGVYKGLKGVQRIDNWGGKGIENNQHSHPLCQGQWLVLWTQRWIRLGSALEELTI